MANFIAAILLSFLNVAQASPLQETRRCIAACNEKFKCAEEKDVLKQKACVEARASCYGDCSTMLQMESPLSGGQGSDTSCDSLYRDCLKELRDCRQFIPGQDGAKCPTPACEAFDACKKNPRSSSFTSGTPRSAKPLGAAAQTAGAQREGKPSGDSR